MNNYSKGDIVKAVISHESQPFCPWQMDMTTDFAKKVRRKFDCEDADQYVGNFLFWAKYKQNKVLPDGQEQDIFGVKWRKSPEGGDVGIVTDSPLKEPSLDNYHFPEIRKDFAASLCDKLDEAKGNHFTMFSLTMGFFERAWSLRGMENILMDMLMEEKFATELFNNIEQHHMELLDLILERDFDALFFADDWGQQKGLIMGPPIWRKYIKPAMSRIFGKVKSSGKLVVLHSCGDLRDIFPELIELGVDVYNTIQPEIYDISELKEKYGNHISFYGGISTQQFLPFATASEVYDQACRTRDILGINGGYILAPTHFLTSDIPMENMFAMVKAAKGESFQ